MNKEQYHNSLHNNLNYNQLIAAAEVSNTQRGEKAWVQQESDYLKYEEILGLKKNALKNSVENAALIEEPFVLDVGSDTSCLASLGVKGVAIGLADTRSPSLKISDEAEGRQFIAGDILNYKTWQKVGRINPKYNRIVSVMEGGLKKITDNALVQYHLLNRMWRLLDSNNGEMFVQTQMKTDRYVLASVPTMYNGRWISFLRKKGVEVTELERGLKFTKNTSSPAFLPLNQIEDTIYTQLAFRQ